MIPTQSQVFQSHFARLRVVESEAFVQIPVKLCLATLEVMAACLNHVQMFSTRRMIKKRLRLTGRRRVIVGCVEHHERDGIEFGDKLT